ncbi:MAG TPA: MarR family transcriptional regulator [Ktedonobacteraceae bacterium]|nr:MarR family transcriptional regulator [Ktedonobacteraceae bacterium]
MDFHQEISVSEYQALAEFRYQLRRFLRFSEEAARAVGLEPQQHQLLLALKGLPEQRTATVGELAERLQIQHHSAVELINRMVERDLIERSRDENDQRRVNVSLTENGDEVLRRLSLLHHEELRTTGPALVYTLMALTDKGNSNGTRSK